MMSNYTCRVVPFTMDYVSVHTNADKLVLFRPEGTAYQVCLNKADWFSEDGKPLYDRAAYVEPDTVVRLNKPEFSWLSSLHKDKLTVPETHRVRAKKLRGENSFGFMIKVDPSVPIGEDLWEKLELEHWNPPEPTDNSQSVRAPQRDFSKYDVDNLKKYWKVFEGKVVVATEKLHGQNSRVCYQDEQIYVGSRSYWKADIEGSDFWRSYRSAPGLETLVKENSHLCVYGESYGNNAGFTYDCEPGKRRFRAFDIYDMGRNCWLDWLDFQEICIEYKIPICPLIWHGVFDMELLLKLAEEDSVFGKGKIREGLVVCTEKESYDSKLGRCKAKIVSCRYLEKS